MACSCNKNQSNQSSSNKNCRACGLIECDSPKQAYVRLGYVEGKPTSIGLFSSWGDSDVDISSLVKKSETNTKMLLNSTDRTIDYYPELFISSDGHQGCINIVDLYCMFQLMHLNEIGDVNVPNPHTGQTITYNETTHKWEPYNIVDEVKRLDTRIDNLNTKLDNHIKVFNDTVASINQNIASLTNRVNDIENLIYNYPADKNTKIPRSNINHFSGDPDRRIGILSHDGVADNDTQQG